MVSSINFALKSSDEQQAIINAYMQFLNSFDYPLQIVIQSRKLNIDKYLEKLKQAEKVQINELLRLQIADYNHYISELIKIGDIMTKKFYVVIPYSSLADKRRGFWSRTTDIFSSFSAIKLSDKRFQQHKKELLQRVNHIIGGFRSIGLEAKILDTQSLIELFYNSYNPDLADSEKVTEINKVQLEK